MTPSTPPEVLEERRKATTKAAKRIEEVKELCAKVAEQVCHMRWEYLITDDDLDKITEQLRTIETEVNQLKSEMKKLPLVEKMAKDTDMKILQQ